ncbi:hypothetical protein SmJEL517_g05191 [Synchytrium microbalum]|uniref:3-oxoacyl-[acyl-carrier-protein] reductase n=1 Tax=Synchytrium microbalum TaxID=1806994 RepID=A0A507BMT5_9FUNG|nr:uncharacterized protein SmJEL517_g05191 [Synchytrium microbalum]TPX31500.1 hypothetical protein SmJEL517_g05191 [Synchytrium microbalum]
MAALATKQVVSHLASPQKLSASTASPPPKLANLVCVLSGCNSRYGIGWATALEFAKHQPKALFVTDIHSDKLDDLVNAIKEISSVTTAHAMKMDQSLEADVAGVVDEALKLYGRLDVFFINGGILGANEPLLGGESATNFMDVMKVNALGPFVGCKHGARGMLVTSKDKPVPKGSIIVTSSIAGLNGGTASIAYGASKAASINLVKHVAIELKGNNIRVNAILPGMTETGMSKPAFDGLRASGRLGILGDLNPLLRHAMPQEMATVVVFLASEDASYINGTSITVDGGWTASHPFLAIRPPNASV